MRWQVRVWVPQGCLEYGCSKALLANSLSNRVKGTSEPRREHAESTHRIGVLLPPTNPLPDGDLCGGACPDV